MRFIDIMEEKERVLRRQFATGHITKEEYTHKSRLLEELIEEWKEMYG